MIYRIVIIHIIWYFYPPRSWWSPMTPWLLSQLFVFFVTESLHIKHGGLSIIQYSGLHITYITPCISLCSLEVHKLVEPPHLLQSVRAFDTLWNLPEYLGASCSLACCLLNGADATYNVMESPGSIGCRWRSLQWGSKRSGQFRSFRWVFQWNLPRKMATDCGFWWSSEDSWGFECWNMLRVTLVSDTCCDYLWLWLILEIWVQTIASQRVCNGFVKSRPKYAPAFLDPEIQDVFPTYASSCCF